MTSIGSAPDPQLFLVYDTVRAGGTTVDELIDGVAFQLGVAGSRRGRFGALYASHADAIALEAELSTAATFDLVDVDRPLLNMTFVVPKSGTIAVSLDPRTRSLWTVSWDFREVPA